MENKQKQSHNHLGVYMYMQRFYETEMHVLDIIVIQINRNKQGTPLFYQIYMCISKAGY
jgi:hypothetical protein